MAWIVIDNFLTHFGLILFFWGFTTILVRGSGGFQKLVSMFSRFLGDVGTLATKNVKRNPVRVASVAFLVALIIGYSFLTVGKLASEEDYIIREVNENVGADMGVSLLSGSNFSAIVKNVTGIQGVSSTTMQYSFVGQASTIVDVENTKILRKGPVTPEF